MIKNINNTRVKFLGDVHIGRVFKTGVPLSRRGERETLIKDQFAAELASADFDVFIQVGDLFDRFRVDLNDVVFVAETIIAAAWFSPARRFYFVVGNHDLSKDLSKVSSFHMVAKLCASVPNVDFVIDTPLHVNTGVVDFVLFPWSPTLTAEQVASVYPNKTDFVVGHWDHVAVDNTSNLIPLEILSKITNLAVSGHDHVAKSYTYGNLKVEVTGSMQPYSFSEDPDEKMYVTRTLDQVLNDPNAYRNLNLRILLKEGEEAPEVDCLMLRTKKIKEDDKPELEVGFEDGLDMKKLFKEVMVDVDISVSSEVEAKFEETVNA